MRFSPLVLSAALIAGTVSAVAPIPALAATPSHPSVHKIAFGKTNIFRGGKNGPFFSIVIDKPSHRGFKARRLSSRSSLLPIPLQSYDGRHASIYSLSAPDPQSGFRPWEINRHRPDRAWVRLAWLNPHNLRQPIITYEFPIYSSDRAAEGPYGFFPVSVQPGLVIMWHDTIRSGRHTYARMQFVQDKSGKPCNPHVAIPEPFNMTLPLGPFAPSPIMVKGKGKSLKLAGGTSPGTPLFLNVMAQKARCSAGLSVVLYPWDNVYMQGTGEILVKNMTVYTVPKRLVGAASGKAELRLLPPH